MIESYTFVVKYDVDSDEFMAVALEVPDERIYAPSADVAVLELIEHLKDVFYEEGPEPLSIDEALEEVGLF